MSFVIYGGTIAWIVSRMPDRRRWVWILGTIIAVASVIEMVIIVGQAARGTHSHFNVSTALNGAPAIGPANSVALSGKQGASADRSRTGSGTGAGSLVAQIHPIGG